MNVKQAEKSFRDAVNRGATRRQLATLEAAVERAHTAAAATAAKATRRARLEREARDQKELAQEQDRRDRADAIEDVVRASQTPTVEFHVGGRTITISLGHPDHTSQLVP